MATTTNYGWETPDDTDLVKDGALAQRTTANAIDNSLFNITTGKNVGLVHLNTTTFTSQSVINISSIFSATYDNYKFVIDITSATNNTYLAYFLLAGATPATAGYNWAAPGYNSTGGATNSFGSAQSFGYLTDLTSTSSSQTAFTGDLISPYLTTATKIMGSGTLGNASGFRTNVGSNTNATSYDGLRIATGAGTTSGTIRIYGYRNS